MKILKRFSPIFYLFFFIAFFVRFFWLEKTAVFFWDQAYDLRQIQLFYEEKRITLIGPISEYGDKIFGSLSYYMLLPFAVLGKFSTASTSYGAAFYGFTSIVGLVAIVHLLNKRFELLAIGLASIWFPLVESSRWAWNPHLVIFWITFGLLFSLKKKNKFFLFFSGLFFGFSIHNHFIALFSTITYVFLQLLFSMKEKELSRKTFFFFGYIIAISPFILFDFTHPPGLFLSKFFLFGHANVSFSPEDVLLRFFSNVHLILYHYTQNVFIEICLGISLFGLIFWDSRKNVSNLVPLIVWFAQIFGVSLLKGAHPHYFLPALPFFFLYIFEQRKSAKLLIKISPIFFLCIGSFLTIYPQITSQKFVPEAWKPNIETVDEITAIVQAKIKNNSLKGVNLAVLGSSDPNRYGWKYRSLLEIQGLNIMSKYEYFTNSYLFVISKKSADLLRVDVSPEMERFRNGVLVESWITKDKDWQIHLFSF